MEFVLDASIAAAWIFEDERSELADEIIDSLAEIRSRSHRWALKRGISCWFPNDGGRIDREAQAHARCSGDLAVIEEPQPQGITFGVMQDLAVRHCLSSYDAAYLELAIRLQLPLATLDASPRKAAEQENVPLIELV